MAWYSTGTVALTNGSAVVIGSGTQFITNTKSGDIFICLDNGLLYEIDEIVSATQITLKRNYLGATNASAQYNIVPTTSNLKLLAQQVTDLITLYQGASQNVVDAQAAASAAQGYRDTAKTYSDNVGAALTTTQGYRDSAKTYSDNAAASASAADGSKQAAATSASNAATSKSGADTAKQGADTSASNASASAALAAKWASQDTTTVDGTNYSAKYYASVAQSAVASVTFPISVANGGTGATTAANARTNLGLGTAATQNTGTSGATIPLLSATNTWAGTQTLSGAGGATGYYAFLNNDKGQNAGFVWQKALSNRWALTCEGTAEGGSNAGSNLILSRYTDAGALIDSPISITRSTGVVAMNSMTTSALQVISGVITCGSTGAGQSAARFRYDGMMQLTTNGEAGFGGYSRIARWNDANTFTATNQFNYSGTGGYTGAPLWVGGGGSGALGYMGLSSNANTSAINIRCSSTNSVLEVVNYNSSGYASVTCSSLTQTSDEALKTGIAPMQNTRDRLRTMPRLGVTYTMKAGGPEQIGIIAQDWQEKFPQVITEGTVDIDDDGDFIARQYAPSTEIMAEEPVLDEDGNPTGETRLVGTGTFTGGEEIFGPNGPPKARKVLTANYSMVGVVALEAAMAVDADVIALQAQVAALTARLAALESK